MWIPDKNNDMTLTDGVVDPARADTSTDLLLRYVFYRRGFALEMYDLLSFENHELLAGLLIAEMITMRISISEMVREPRRAKGLI